MKRRSKQYISSCDSALPRMTRTIHSISFLLVHLTISFFIYPLPFPAPLNFSSRWLWSGQVDDKLSCCHACYSGLNFQIVAEDCLFHSSFFISGPKAVLLKYFFPCFFSSTLLNQSEYQKNPKGFENKSRRMPRNYEVLRTPA